MLSVSVILWLVACHGGDSGHALKDTGADTAADTGADTGTCQTTVTIDVRDSAIPAIYHIVAWIESCLDHVRVGESQSPSVDGFVVFEDVPEGCYVGTAEYTYNFEDTGGCWYDVQTPEFEVGCAPVATAIDTATTYDACWD